MEQIIAAAEACHEDKEGQQDKCWIEEPSLLFSGLHAWLRCDIAISWSSHWSTVKREWATWHRQIAIASREMKARAGRREEAGSIFIADFWTADGHWLAHIDRLHTHFLYARDDRGNVVGAAILVRALNQVIHAFLRHKLIDRAQQILIVDQSRKAVATEDQGIAFFQHLAENIDFHLRLGSQAAGNHIALRMCARLLLSQQPGAYLLSNPRMVLRDLIDARFAHEISAAVTYIRDIGQVPAQHCRDTGFAHATAQHILC